MYIISVVAIINLFGGYSMFKVKEVIKVNFDESVSDYVLKDGISSVIYYFYDMLIIYLFGLIVFKTNINQNIAIFFSFNKQFYRFISYIPIAILQLAPVFIFIKVRKQKFKSIGFKADKNLKSALLGIIFSLPFILPSLIIGISKHISILNSPDLFWLFLYYLIEIALVEEISFRGFIQTRMHGLIKTKWISVIAVGIMFSLMHIPFQMIKAGMPLTTFIVNDSVHLLTTCVIHIYLVYLYTRDNNIVSTTIAHTLIDFIPSMFI